MTGGTAMTERRIYHEDTDAGGVVYHANYLRYLEQGRTEFLRERGFSVKALQERGYFIPVMRLEIDYLVPAVLDDLIRVETEIQEVTSATFVLTQRAIRVSDGEVLVAAQVTLACTGPGKKARRLPIELIEALKGEKKAVL
jgi:acyl-CoA thioester hydrolase